MSARSVLLIAGAVLAMVLGGVAAVWLAADDEPRRIGGITTTEKTTAQKWLLFANDGKYLGPVKSVEGCASEGAVVGEVVRQTGLVNSFKVVKQLGKASYARCTLVIDLSARSQLWTWIGDLFNPQKPATKRGFYLVRATAENKPVQVIEIPQAFVTRFGFPRHAVVQQQVGTSKVATEGLGDFEITLTPTSLKRHTPCCPPLDPVPAESYQPVSSVGIQFGSQDVEDVTEIGPYTATRDAEKLTIAFSSGPTLVLLLAGPIDAGQLEVGIAAGPEADDFEKWFDDSVVKGTSTPEKTATIVFLSGGKGALELTLTGVGIFKAELGRYSFYAQGLSLVYSGLQPAPTATPPPAPTPAPATTTAPAATTQTTTTAATTTEPPPQETTPTSETKGVAAPERLRAEVGDTSIVLTWSAVEGAEGYVALTSTQPGGPYTELARPTDTTYTVPRPEAGTLYFVVRAFAGEVESENSIEVSAEVG